MNSMRIFTASGRLSRGRFWLLGLLVWLVFYVLWSLMGGHSTGLAVWVINLPMLAALILLCIRRLHDRNKSGWWLLAVVVPVLGALWLVWQLAFRRGVAGDNRWGPDPVQNTKDYLVVQ